MAGPLHIAYDTRDGRIVVTDSLTYCDDRITPLDVVVGGSFIGEYPAAVALRAGARAVIGHAAGVGKDEAGIAGLPLADRWGLPCAAVSSDSARIADGMGTYREGEVSHANRAAAAFGVRIGMGCEEAARLLLSAPRGEKGRAAELVHAECEVVYEGPEGRVAAMASVGLATRENAEQVICAGSHTGAVTHRYVSGYEFPVAGIICSDAAVGRDRAGIAGLEPLAVEGIAAASVSYRSARIGEGRSTYADGTISFANRVAEEAGVRVGMPACEAALLMLRFYNARKGDQRG
jgi:hypothetical protein